MLWKYPLHHVRQSTEVYYLVFDPNLGYISKKSCFWASGSVVCWCSYATTAQGCTIWIEVSPKAYNTTCLDVAQWDSRLLLRHFVYFFFFFFLKCKLSSETFSCKDYTLLASLRNQQGTCWKISSDEWIIIIINLFYAWRLCYPPIFSENSSRLTCLLSFCLFVFS